MKRLRVVLTSLVVWTALVSCGGGVPVRLRIDEFTMELALDDAVDQVYQEFLARGMMSPATPGFPEQWPHSLSDIKYHAIVATPPVPVDLSPEVDPDAEPEIDPETGEPIEDPNADKYEQINQVKEAIKRIELNRLILRVEASTLTTGLPPLRLQIADAIDANPDDRLAWWTIGTIPGTDEPGFVGDLELEFVPGGESFLNAQLADEKKELAMRAVGDIEIDTEKNRKRPGGKAVVRLIVVATFFVEPKDAL